jgi:hypothetical protein
MSNVPQNNRIPINDELKVRKEFSEREVGLTHPDLSSFLRLNDSGDIEIFAAPGVGIVISSKSRSVSIFADSIKMFTKDDGLRWNSYNFNSSSHIYSEPTLVKINRKNINSAQREAMHYLNFAQQSEEEERQKTITITGDFGLQGNRIPEQQEEQSLVTESDYSGLSFEEIGLLEAYSTDYSKSHIDLMIKFIREGMTFSQAHQKALREFNG